MSMIIEIEVSISNLENTLDQNVLNMINNIVKIIQETENFTEFDQYALLQQIEQLGALYIINNYDPEFELTAGI